LVADIFNTPNILVLVIGVLGSMALILRRANGDIHRGLFVRPYSVNPSLYPAISAKISTQIETGITVTKFSLRKLLSPLFKIIYKLHYFAVMVIIFFLASLSEIILLPESSNHSILFYLIIVYGITNSLYLIREIIGEYFSIETKLRKIENDFEERFSS
jgi:hypothetical protein